MLTLGLETSGTPGGIALLEAGTVLGERDLSAASRHARALLSEIGELLNEAGRCPAECRLLAVDIGPGSFTGLRVGVVCAKTWAYATECDIVGVDSLQVVASQSPPEIQVVDVVADAQRGELFLGRYERDPGGFRPQGTIRIIDREAWLDSLTERTCVSGPALETLADRVRDRCQVVPPHCWMPTARQVAFLAWHSHCQGVRDDLFALTPKYLRRSAAEEKADGAVPLSVS